MRPLLEIAMRPYVVRFTTVMLILIVSAATLTPSENMPSSPPGSDKLHHFLAFGAIAFNIALLRPRYTLYAILAVSAYGAMIEVIQPHVGRHGDVMDAIANTIGAIAGGLAGFAINRAIKARGPTPKGPAID